MNTSDFMDVLPVVMPLLVIWLIMLIAGLADLIRRKQTRGPKWVWYFIVICFSILGPALYFLFGREEA
jgi:predicted membrane-bound dolichyl-phosphate-mannose-protein mannosyltransferase